MSDNSIKDFSKNLPKAKYKNRHRLSRKSPFSLIISGHSGCGKTNLLLNLICKYLHFNRLYVYASNLNEPYYEYLQNIDSELREIILDKYGDYFKFYNSSDDVVPLENIDSTKQNLVVFDDFINENDQSKISDYFTMGRKYNCTVIYISQSYYRNPRKIRLSTSFFAVYNPRNKQEITLFRKEFPLSISNKEFETLLKKATSKKYNFLFIDTITNDDKLKYRINLGATKNNGSKWKNTLVFHITEIRNVN